MALVQEDEEDTIGKQFDELNSKVDKILEIFEQEVKEINAVATILLASCFSVYYTLMLTSYIIYSKKFKHMRLSSLTGTSKITAL